MEKEQKCTKPDTLGSSKRENPTKLPRSGHPKEKIQQNRLHSGHPNKKIPLAKYQLCKLSNSCLEDFILSSKRKKQNTDPHKILSTNLQTH